jgi:hypothetical protein
MRPSRFDEVAPITTGDLRPGWTLERPGVYVPRVAVE